MMPDQDRAIVNECGQVVFFLLRMAVKDRTGVAAGAIDRTGLGPWSTAFGRLPTAVDESWTETR